MTDKELFEKLSYKPKNVYEQLDDVQTKEMLDMAAEYREFLDNGKTERECVKISEKAARENGFREISEYDALKPGDKVYIINRKKNILLAVIGEKNITEGVNIIGAHIDSPRLDLKQNPLYESNEAALLKTHYYGGIKKYQWTAIPLALHGVVFTRDGEELEITIGEKETDPVFCVTDLLPHLAVEQMNKKLCEGIEGEALNILVGGMGVKSEDVPEKVKFKILSILNTMYGIRETDFLSAEFEAVPAFKARNVGLDESFIGAYGQDDRVCAFTSLKSILDTKNPARTALCLLVDKEEIGSTGNTGMLSRFFEMSLAEIIKKCNGSCDLIDLNHTITGSACLSSDVGAAVDSNYENVYEKKNAAFAGHGMVLMKYTGSRGKSGASDASAEFVHEITSILDKNNVVWQTSELGKVDGGGGGTIAMYVANLNMDVIDCGVPVLSMHSPFEVTAKGDIYMAYKTYMAFFKDR